MNNNINLIRYRTNYLPASPKKLKAVAVQLKNLSLDQAMLKAQFSHKSFSKILFKDFESIKNNLINIKKMENENVNNMIIRKIIIEKKHKFLGHRMKARGHASTSIKQMCTLNVFLVKKFLKEKTN